jgi:hypothetical protein
MPTLSSGTTPGVYREYTSGYEPLLRRRVQNLENFKEGYSLKSKKLFAILTLIAFMMTLVPVLAFGAGEIPQVSILLQ